MKKHIMFVSLPFRGHASQMIVLAQELLGRGYQVSFALSEDTRDWVNNTGVIFHPWDPNLEASDLKKIILVILFGIKLPRNKVFGVGKK